METLSARRLASMTSHLRPSGERAYGVPAASPQLSRRTETRYGPTRWMLRARCCPVRIPPIRRFPQLADRAAQALLKLDRVPSDHRVHHSLRRRGRHFEDGGHEGFGVREAHPLLEEIEDAEARASAYVAGTDRPVARAKISLAPARPEGSRHRPHSSLARAPGSGACGLQPSKGCRCP